MNNDTMLLYTLVAALMPLLLLLAFLLGRRFQRPVRTEAAFSPVTRQHFELFQGGPLNRTAIESAKRRFTELFDQGDHAAVEASLRPGMQYVFQVRALTEIGTEDAGRILERQLRRRLSDDALEQAWYWIDLAEGLRHLHREESLPHLLRCAAAARELPLAHLLAAETVCFLGFAGYLQDLQSPLGRSANLVLHRALEGFRFGVPLELAAEARLGEVLETLWDRQGGTFHPLHARIALATLRLLARASFLTETVADAAVREDCQWQLGRLQALEPLLQQYLDESPPELQRRLARATGTDAEDVLLAINDLRVDLGPDLIGWAAQADNPCRDLAIEAMTWSRDARVGPWLRDYGLRQVAMTRRAQLKPQSESPRRSSVSPAVPYHCVLRALRGHPSPETERFLALASQDWDPRYRVAAFGSLGWWEPLLPLEVLPRLAVGRVDPNADVRRAARAALARLGERQALHWFRQALTAEDDQALAEGIQHIANEGLTLLWPDLDSLVDADRPEIKAMAREALTRLSEEMDWERKGRKRH